MKKTLFLLLIFLSFLSFAQDIMVDSSAMGMLADTSSTPVVSENAEQSEFLTSFLNGMDKDKFLAMLLWGILGTFGNIISDIIRRNKKSKSSPEKFSIIYFFQDNWLRLILSFIMLPIVIMSTNEILSIEITPLVSFFIGLSSDHIIEILKRKNLIANAFGKYGDGE